MLFANPSGSNLKFSKKMIKRPQGRKKKNEEGGSGQKRFQQNVLCSSRIIHSTAALLKDSHRSKVRAGDFGFVFDWVLEGNVIRVLMCFLMLSIDASNMTINFGGGRILKMTREAVHQIFGFPIGGIAAPRPSDTCHRDTLALLKRELGLKGTITIKELASMLANLVNNDDKVDLSVKVFYAILFNQLIFPGPAPRIGRDVVMLTYVDDEVMAQSDYFQMVVDELKRAAIKYQDSSISQAGPEDCGLVLTFMYLDSCKCDGIVVYHIRTPHANFQREEPLLDMFYRNMVQWFPSTGKSQFWKARGQCCFLSCHLFLFICFTQI